MAKSYQFKGLLTNDGWKENVPVLVDSQGHIESIGTPALAETELVDGYALPGFQNAHSHAFQYAMAGLAELHDGTGMRNDFWSWRTAMYDLALQVSPDHLEAIATMLYAEMVRHGYTSVAEFHYVHHDKDGKPYSNRAELGERLVAAAGKAGIHITLVPMFYQRGGFGKQAEEKQRRFISRTLEDYYKLLECSQDVIDNYAYASLGQGIHSIRAVDGVDIISLAQESKQERPFHIHVSEQLKEVAECEHFYGKRPVEWLLENLEIDASYHLVHATHINDREVQGIASANANVVLCPTTEGNLGDGLFRFYDYKSFGGSWSIGTDSHVSLDPLEELRLLDYGQRLTTHKRITYFQPNRGDSGFNAIDMAWKAGRKAMGHEAKSFFQVGEAFDAVVMDARAPLIAASGLKHLCNTIVYSSDVSNMLGTIISGEWKAKAGRHYAYDEVSALFVSRMKDLKSRL